jgi:hypothetical protein
MAAKLLQDLKAAIQSTTSELICETHPNICELRDKNYSKLETLIINEILSDKYAESPSVQTAIANLEGEL